MKNTITIIMIVIVLLFTSCGNPVSGPQQRLEEIKHEFSKVGVRHNSDLDELKDLFNEVERDWTLITAKAYINDHYHLQAPASNMHIAEDLSSYLIDMSILSKTTVNTELFDLLSDSLELYARYPEVFDSISYVLDKGESLHNKCLDLEKIYLYIDDQIIDQEDREALMNGLSTTIHSLEYWDENYNEWQQMLGETMSKPALGVAGAIGIIDGAGAVVGTIEGFRDIPKGTEKRGRKIVGRAVGEGVKTSAFAVLSLILL